MPVQRKGESTISKWAKQKRTVDEFEKAQAAKKKAAKKAEAAKKVSRKVSSVSRPSGMY